jgi:hypothetical protein
MKKLLLLAIVFVLFFLIGCTLHITKNISDKLNINELYNAYNVKSTDLSSHSKCAESPTIKIINVESRTEDYEELKNPPFTGVINPKEMMDSVVLYLKNGFEQSHIKINDQSKKVLQIKMIDMKSTAGVWSFGSYFKIELIIPETGFTKFYEASENSGGGHVASAYAIHAVTRQIIDDQEIQNYILCR